MPPALTPTPAANKAGIRGVATMALALGAALPVSGNQETVFPGRHWQERSPAELGLYATPLFELANAVGGSGVIIKDGFLVFRWGERGVRRDWGSALKPVITTLLMFALREKRIGSVHAPLSDLLDGTSLELRGKDRQISFHHLANMISGYGLPEGPGQAWGYSDPAINLYARALFDHVFRSPPNEVLLQRHRLGLLDFEDGAIFDSHARVKTTPRDFARIGWWWLNRGRWGDHQLLPAKFFDAWFRAPAVPAALPRSRGRDTDFSGDYLNMAITGGGLNPTSRGPGIYGNTLWFNPQRRTWPAAPADTFQANGHWNREVLTVIPSLGVVAAWARAPCPPDRPECHDEREQFDVKMNPYLAKLVAAVTANPPSASTRLAAHRLSLEGYRIEAWRGQRLVGLVGGGPAETGRVSTRFAGPAGRYDVIVAYHDEDDGTAEMELEINGVRVDRWQLDQHLQGEEPGDANLRWRVAARNTLLREGTRIQLTGREHGCEHARVRYLEFVPVAAAEIP